VSLGRVSNGFFFALWVAVCAASPEFLWQGFFSFFGHFSPRDGAAALLIGAILAFFVEPVLERLRALNLKPEPDHAEKTPAFAACEALSFAVVAVCVHEAITVYVAASHSNEQASRNLANAVALALQWAAIPFAITVAWIAARARPWIAWSVALAVVVVGYLTALVFDWSLQTLFTSAVPCLLILAGGCLSARRQWDAHTFQRCARVTAVIALAWLVLAGAVQVVLNLAHVKAFALYGWSDFWTDFRFYVGWVIGLVVAPGFVRAPAAQMRDDAWRKRR
jgi:hypothetical protein